MEKYRAFTTDELEILQWSLEDHATKLLVIERERIHSGARLPTRPNLAYLDTQILRNEIEAEIAARKHRAVGDRS